MTSRKPQASGPKDVMRMQLGARLREAREYLGFTQETIAGYLGVPRSALSQMETGHRRVDAFELKQLAKVYERPVAYFTGEAVDGVYEADVEHLARKVSELSSEDRKELARFADFLRARRNTGEE